MKHFRLFELKDISPFKEWGDLLMSKYLEEARESLREEGLTEESVFIFPLDGKMYVAFVLKGHAKPSNPDREINKKHKSVTQKAVGDLVYSITV